MRLSTRIILVCAATAIAAVAASFAAAEVDRHWPMPQIAVWALAALLVSPVVIWSARILISRITEMHDDLGNALRATRDGDYSLRLAVRGDAEIAELKSLYNQLADAVRSGRRDVQNKEILLDTILQRTPIAVVLVDPAGRVIYSNSTARELLAAGDRLDGRLLDDITTRVDQSLRDLLASKDDSLLNLDEETFHVSQRTFRLQAQEHRLLLIERLTPELRRQEVTVWKKAIRIINHEINNSIAPISSLFHSARRAQETPEHHHRIGEIYGLIDERLAFLRTFLESYATFARLPQPRKQRARWADVLDAVAPLYPFRVDGDVESEALIDVAQMQQVLINLVKNAHESGSGPDEVVVSIKRSATDAVISVLDRGKGMSGEVMRQALVPFYSTKPGGTGLGVALCNEIVEAHGGRMRLAAREGGGITVTCWLPL